MSSHEIAAMTEAKDKAAREALGAAIAERRLALGLSQEELAFRAEMHRSYLGDVECGKRNLSLKNILKICRALKLTAADLFKAASI